MTMDELAAFQADLAQWVADPELREAFTTDFTRLMADPAGPAKLAQWAADPAVRAELAQWERTFLSHLTPARPLSTYERAESDMLDVLFHLLGKETNNEDPHTT